MPLQKKSHFGAKRGGAVSGPRLLGGLMHNQGGDDWKGKMISYKRDRGGIQQKGDIHNERDRFKRKGGRVGKRKKGGDHTKEKTEKKNTDSQSQKKGPKIK